MITAMQLKMARAAKGWGVRDLANRAGVNPNTVSRIENGKNATGPILNRIRMAFSDAGVMFFQRGGGFGVQVLPEIDGWLVNLEEGWARSADAVVSFWHDADGTCSIGPIAPIDDKLPKAACAKLGNAAMTAVGKALRQRSAEGSAAMPDRAEKLRQLRAAVDAGMRSGRARDSSMDSILAELDGKN